MAQPRPAAFTVDSPLHHLPLTSAHLPLSLAHLDPASLHFPRHIMSLPVPMQWPIHDRWCSPSRCIFVRLKAWLVGNTQVFLPYAGVNRVSGSTRPSPALSRANGLPADFFSLDS